LVRVRSEEATRRLLGSESIEEIALSIGFSHSKELAREFRKVHGVTPLVYRIRERESGVGSRESGVGSRESGVGSRLTARMGRGEGTWRRFSTAMPKSIRSLWLPPKPPLFVIYSHRRGGGTHASWYE
jgi:hypothetical protein